MMKFSSSAELKKMSADGTTKKYLRRFPAPSQICVVIANKVNVLTEISKGYQLFSILPSSSESKA